MSHVAIVNIYNFIRKTVYPSGQFVEEELETVLYEIEETKRYGFCGTYALKYDALMDENYVKILKDNLDEFDEVACWWEIDESLATKASVKWRGVAPVDDSVNTGYSLSYTPEERMKMIDVYMEDFKSIFGYYPKTVGSWIIDIISLTYFKEKYHIEGAAICRDQIGTDGFTLSGGYYNQAYYPSLVNEFIPAQTKEHQLDLPIFRLLGADPIYAYEDKLRKSVSGVYTLEPAATIAQNKDWVNWFFKRQTDESTIGFSYVQTGQENTFLWNTMSKGYEIQMKHLSEIEDKVRIETLAESAKWYKRKYDLTPVTTLSATEDWNEEENLKTVWYNSRFYRLSFLFEKGQLSIRDLHLFNENYKSRYYDDVLVGNESRFDALPVVDPHHSSTQDLRAAMQFFKRDDEGQLVSLSGELVEFGALNNSDYQVIWSLEDGTKVYVICEENKLSLKVDKSGDDGDIILAMNRCLAFTGAVNNILNFSHNHFDYSIIVEKGQVIELNDFAFAIETTDHVLEMRFSQDILEESEQFFTESYQEHPEEIDQYVPRYKTTSLENNCVIRAKKPIITPKVALKNEGEAECFTIENPNGVGEIYYTLDGTTPTKDSFLYEQPITLTTEGKILAKVFDDGMKESLEEDGRLFQSKPIVSITGATPHVPWKVYNPDSYNTLIDGKKGTKDYRDGAWLAYFKHDLDVTIDLGEITSFKKITVGFIQDTRAWIFYPKEVLFEGSIDGVHFEKITSINCDETLPRREVGLENIEAEKEVNYRYVRVFAANQQYFPQWSILPGEGPTFIFVDQITVL